MKIVKNKNIVFILAFLFLVTSIFPILKEKRVYTFTDRSKDKEYILKSNFRGRGVLTFYEGYFERIEKVGENNDYFVLFFLSARNEKVETLSIKNYYIIDKNTNEIYRVSEKDVMEKGITLDDINIFLKKKGVVIHG